MSLAANNSCRQGLAALLAIYEARVSGLTMFWATGRLATATESWPSACIEAIAYRQTMVRTHPWISPAQWPWNPGPSAVVDQYDVKKHHHNMKSALTKRRDGRPLRGSERLIRYAVIFGSSELARLHKAERAMRAGVYAFS